MEHQPSDIVQVSTLHVTIALALIICNNEIILSYMTTKFGESYDFNNCKLNR